MIQKKQNVKKKFALDFLNKGGSVKQLMGEQRYLFNVEDNQKLNLDTHLKRAHKLMKILYDENYSENHIIDTIEYKDFIDE